MKYDLIVIGSGPAGLTAAIYAKRANLNVLIIEKEVNGGKLSKTNEIENYPGYNTITGMQLADNIVEHAKKLNAEIISGNVIDIDYNSKKVKLNNGDEYQAKAIIIATGTKENHLNLPYSEEFVGKGISYCAVCDGFFYRKKDVAVIGGGNSALQEALYLANIVNKVYIIIRRDVFRADDSLVNRIKNCKNIEIIYKHIPNELLISNGVIEGLSLKNVEDNTIKNIAVEGIFPYIGNKPNTNFLSNSLLDENGYINVKNDMSTIYEGIYAAGDCIKKELRQIITACSDGAIAASSAINYIKNSLFSSK